MSTARVQSTGAIRAFRPALHAFVHAGQSAIDEIKTSFQRTIQWLLNDQRDHWKSQIRRHTESVARAQEAVRQKTLFTDATGARPSAVEEKQSLRKAQRQLEEAHAKLDATVRWARTLEKQAMEFTAGAQQLALVLEHDIPNAVARLDRLLDTLSDYAAESQVSSSGPASDGETDDEPNAEAPS
jgi:hypothetical protein